MRTVRRGGGLGSLHALRALMLCLAPGAPAAVTDPPALLQAVAYELRKVLREGELVFRLGGEEFLVLLPDADAPASAAVAERIRAAVAAARPAGLDVTVSVGVSARDRRVEYATLFGEADAALYEAKRGGRDRVVVHSAAVPVRAVA